MDSTTAKAERCMQVCEEMSRDRTGRTENGMGGLQLRIALFHPLPTKASPGAREKGGKEAAAAAIEIHLPWKLALRICFTSPVDEILPANWICSIDCISYTY